MKRGLLITTDFWPRTGGIATHYTSLLNYAKRFEGTALTTPQEEGSLNQNVPRCRVLRREFFFKRFWPRWLRLAWQVARIQKREKFDFIIVGEVLPVGSAVWLAKRIHRKPYVVFVHGTDLAYAQKSSTKHFLSKRVLRGAALIVANSEFTRARAIAFGLLEDKIRILYPGFVPFAGKAQPDPRARHGLEGKRILLGVNRIVERKGIQYVLAALERLRRAQNDVFYVHLGSGPYLSQIRAKIAELGLESATLIREDANDAERQSWLETADLFAMTPVELADHDHEGFGIVYLEAAAAGLASVASRTGGVPEAVVDGQTGLLVDDPRDTEALAEVINHLLEDDGLRARLGAAGKKRVEEQFSWTHQAKVFEQALEEKGMIGV